jgi:outer membrane lipoprotein-sorting protein
VPDGPPDDFLAKMLAALHHAEQAANPPRTISLKKRILAMKPTTKVAIAATVLIAVGGLLAWVAPSGGTALAELADVAEALADVRTATWNTRNEYTVSIKDPKLGKVETPCVVNGKSMYLAPSRERHERPETVNYSSIGFPVTLLESIRIFDHQSGQETRLSPTTGTAMILELSRGPDNTLERFRRLVEKADGEGEKLGLQTIDGRETVAFRIVKGDGEIKLWADPETGLPVRYESTSSYMNSRTVWSDFRYNVDLDESLFSLEVPDGYTIAERGSYSSTSRRKD